VGVVLVAAVDSTPAYGCGKTLRSEQNDLFFCEKLKRCTAAAAGRRLTSKGECGRNGGGGKSADSVVRDAPGAGRRSTACPWADEVAPDATHRVHGDLRATRETTTPRVAQIGRRHPVAAEIHPLGRKGKDLVGRGHRATKPPPPPSLYNGPHAANCREVFGRRSEAKPPGPGRRRWAGLLVAGEPGGPTFTAALEALERKAVTGSSPGPTVEASRTGRLEQPAR